MAFKYDVGVVGGAGHVGLPLAAAFASAGSKVVIYDLNREALAAIRAKRPPFLEKGLEERLKKVVGRDLFLSDKASVISLAKYVVVVIGTPVDEYLNPKFSGMREFFKKLMPHFRAGQIVILRSTVFPGTSQAMAAWLAKHKLKVEVAFCPERIAEGNALEELHTLPQIVSGFNRKTVEKVKELFLKVAKEVLELQPLEAELAKIFTNCFRYIQFAIANQFFEIAQAQGLDYYKIYNAITHNYPRAKGFARAGFAAGPCLLKDTMQLAAFSRNTFFLGHAAMLINEGLPNYVVASLKQKINLSKKTVGILGMAFKEESDDRRDSLSYKLKKLLEIEAAEVLCHDAYIKDPAFIKQPEGLIRRAEIVVIGTPHKIYKNLSYGSKKVVDIWNLLGKGAEV